jgi:uncharacterized protein (DUF302 family)
VDPVSRRLVGRIQQAPAIPAAARGPRRSAGEVNTMIEESSYGLRVNVGVPFDAAVARATDALRAEGFGVLTTIDMQQALREKLGREIRPYTILGACNPPLASRALDAEPEIGLLLPCNVLVYEREDGHATVAAMARLAALAVVGDNAGLQAVAAEVDVKLRRVLAAVAG